MNILMIGGVSSLLNQLIRKIKKEGHRVYLLTGDRYGDAAYVKVFERYDLSYDSVCLSDVFESVNPDVTVFMGAFDSNFRWTNEERELVRLTSGLTNMLTAHAMAGKGRFIFLSSEEVYEESYETDILEDTPTSPVKTKGMALAQCEDICASFRRNRDTDVVVLRLDHFYLIPIKPDEVNDVCSGMCLEALRNGSISADSGKHFSLLYESDAVEFVFRMVKCAEHEHSLYNISSAREVTELEIAQYIQKAMDDDADISIDEKEGELHRCILDNQRFDEEFNVKIFADTQATIEKLVKYMTAHKNVFLTGEEEKKGLWKRLKERTGWVLRTMFPYLENLVCFILVLLLNYTALGSRYLQGLDLYLLYVLLFAVVYGQQQATISAILSVVGFFLLQSGNTSFLTVALDYNTYIWIAQLFIVGLVVGYIKDRIRKMQLESEEERKFMNRQLSDIKDINGSNVRVKDALETEVVNQRDSVGKVYRVTSRLEQYMPEEVLFYAAETLRDLLGSEDIAIYTVSNDTYARLFTYTSERAKVLGKSLRYRELGEVYETVVAGKVFINRGLDNRYPMMANAIFDDDQVKTLIMVWGLPWERMTLGQADLLMVVSYLIQNAVLRATRLIAMLENQRYQEYGHVMDTEPFTALVRAFLTARNKNLTECAILQIVLPEETAGVRSEPVPVIVPVPVPASEPDPEPEPDFDIDSEISIDYTPGFDFEADPVSAPGLTPRRRRSRKRDGLSVILNERSLFRFSSPFKTRSSRRGRVPAEAEKTPNEPYKPTETPFDLTAVPVGGMETSVEPEGMPAEAAGTRTELTGTPVMVVDTSVEPEKTPAVRISPEKVEEVGNALVSKIRQEDYIGTLADGKLYILLSNGNNTEAGFVIKRIEDAGYHCILMEDFSV